MESETQTEKQDSSDRWFKVTPISKYLAMALFILLPFIGGWIGYSYAPEKVIETEVVMVVTDRPEPITVRGEKLTLITESASTSQSARELVRGSATDRCTSPEVWKDERYVYVGEEIMSGADPKKIQMLDAFYATDGEKVWYKSQLLDGVVYGDFTFYPEYTFKTCAGEHFMYARSTSDVYCYGEIIDGADVKSFALLENAFAKDNTTLFSGCKTYSSYMHHGELDPVDSMDLPTLNHIAGHYYADKNNVYFYVQYIETDQFISIGADPDTFSFIKDVQFYVRDKNSLYYTMNGMWTSSTSQKLIGSDPDTFEVLGGSYEKDAKQVYFGRWPYEGFPEKKVVIGADAATFELLTGSRLGSFARDKNRVYYNGKVFDLPDLETVRPITGLPDVISDKDHLYVGSWKNPQIIDYVDAKTFVITDPDYQKYDDGMVYKMLAEDVNNKYVIELTDDEYRFTTIVKLES